MFTPLRGDAQAQEGWLTRRIIWFAIAILCVLSVTDPDLWGHLRFGLDIIRNRTVAGLESYSYTSDLPLTNHEWLDEALMALVYRLAGAPGLILLKTIVVGGAYVLIARAYKTARSPVAELVALAAAIVCLPLTITLRPQIWSFLFVAILSYVELSPFALAVIPLLFLCWANLHGGWVVGVALLFWRCTGAMWRRRHVDLALLGVLPVSVAATLINPYGVGLWRFMASTLRLERADITEWQPIWTGDSFLNLAGWGLGVAVLVAFLRRTIKRRPEHAIALAGFAFAAQRVQRLVPLFVVSALLLVAPDLPSARSDVPLSAPASPRVRRLIEAFLLAIVVASTTFSLGPRLWCIATQPLAARPDAAAAATLANRSLSGHLAVEFDWGEYAIWHFGPRLRVSVDGRRETIYSERVLAEQRALADGSPTGLGTLDRDRPEYIWMRRTRETLRRELAAHSYRVDILTDRSYVAVRNDLPPLTPAVAITSSCFPDL